MVSHLSTQQPPKRLVIRWTTLKGLVAIVLFLIIALLIEYLIVLYAFSIGVREKPENLLQLSFLFPGTNWMINITISPLFHLIPIAVTITLLFNWIYLARHIATKLHDTSKEKASFAAKKEKEQKRKFLGKISSGLLKVKGIAYIWRKIHFARATIKSALTIFLAFTALILVVSLLAYPNLIYQTISNVYQNNPSLLSFIKNTEKALSPIFELFSAIGGALVPLALSLRSLGLSIGAIFAPLVNLDNVGKYLVFQNVAAWVSALATLFYGNYARKSPRYRKIRKS